MPLDIFRKLFSPYRPIPKVPSSYMMLGKELFILHVDVHAPVADMLFILVVIRNDDPWQHGNDSHFIGWPNMQK